MTSNEVGNEKIENDNKPCIFLDANAVRSFISYPALIQHLRVSLPSISTSIQSPIRQNFFIDASSSLLLMPSWSLSPSLPYIGIKIVTSFPQNSARNLPGINASYLLFDSVTGRNLAVMDGTEMTLWRTSCISAIAAQFLVREDAEILVMIGAGSLASYLIKAHLFVRPGLKRVVIWNRNGDKARDLAKKLQEEEMGDVCFEHGECLEEIVGLGDVISCATSSERPLVSGRMLKAGAHLDLVGSFKHSMVECDDDAIRRGKVFVDGEAALEESGELVGAFERGVISVGDVAGRLVNLVRGDKVGRSEPGEITVFKSVGSAVVDILTAQLVYESCLSGNKL